MTHIIVRATENNTCDANFECLIGLANGWFIVNENCKYSFESYYASNLLLTSF